MRAPGILAIQQRIADIGMGRGMQGRGCSHAPKAACGVRLCQALSSQLDPDWRVDRRKAGAHTVAPPPFWAAFDLNGL
jgi:hypothetical protein